MKHKNYFLGWAIALLVVMSSCKQEKVNVKVLQTNGKPTEVITIQDDILTEEIDFSKLVNSIDFIPLETTNECLIGRIDKILSDSEYYFIHDRSNKNLFRFRKDGKFLNKIGSKGQGPKDYIDIWNIALDKKSHTIDVLDLAGRKIVKYSYDGTFVKTIKMPYLYTEFEYAGDMIAIKTGNSYNKNTPSIDGFQLVISDLEQTPLSKAFPVNPNNNSFTTNEPLRKFNDSIFFHLPFSNAIWELNKKDTTLHKKIQFDFGDKGWENQQMINTLKTNEIRKLLNEHIHFSGNYVFSSTHNFFDIVGPVIDKSTGRILSGKVFQDIKSKKFMYGGNTLVNYPRNIDGFLFGEPKWVDDDKFITTKSAHTLYNWKKYILKSDDNKLTKEELKKLNSIKEGDNPIIIIYSLKHF